MKYWENLFAITFYWKIILNSTYCIVILAVHVIHCRYIAVPTLVQSHFSAYMRHLFTCCFVYVFCIVILALRVIHRRYIAVPTQVQSHFNAYTKVVRRRLPRLTDSSPTFAYTLGRGHTNVPWISAARRLKPVEIYRSMSGHIQVYILCYFWSCTSWDFVTDFLTVLNMEHCRTSIILPPY